MKWGGQTNLNKIPCKPMYFFSEMSPKFHPKCMKSMDKPPNPPNCEREISATLSSPKMSSGVGIRAWGLRFIYTAEKPPFQRCKFAVNSRRMLATFCSAASGSEQKKKVIVISGPTGAGKSKVALEVSKRLNGEIISADSVQVYRGLDVGSAKPSKNDRMEVPHHLLDILDPSEDYSAGKFFEDSRQATRDIFENGHVPIVAGGTGLYLRWYIYGKPEVPKASPEIASEAYKELIDLQRMEDWDAAVQLVVKAGDPKAQDLPLNDWYRLRRSLEIIKASGSPPSAFRVPYDSYKEQLESRKSDPTDNTTLSGDGILSQDLDYDFICFFLSNQRLDLYRMIDLRCEDMVSGSDGILAEASRLLDAGLLPNSNSATRAIGYRQAMDYLLKCREQEGGSTPSEFMSFLSEFQKASRNFAKRQMTWYRNELIYHWLDASQPMEKVVNFICDAYHDQTENLLVPESLIMKRDASSRREISALNAYRTKNRSFVRREDCNDVLDWIKRTQCQPTEAVC